MRFGPKVLALLGLIAVGGYLVSSFGESPAGEPREYTFSVTPLTDVPFQVQHGIETYITLNLLEVEGGGPVQIDDLPEFPLTATLAYQTVDGQKRKVSSSYGYRC